MSEPLTREERDGWISWGVMPARIYELLLRYEATVTVADDRTEVVIGQMLLVSEGIVTALLHENDGDPPYDPDHWSDTTRVLVGELSRIALVVGLDRLPPAVQGWIYAYDDRPEGGEA